MYIPIYENTKIKKKTCCIKIIPADCFACEAHQGTQQLKKQYYLRRKKYNKAKIKS